MITQHITTRIRSEAAKVLVGQEEAFTQLLIALFSFVSSSAMAKFILRGEVIE